MSSAQASRSQATQQKILGATFLEVYHRGFQLASLDDIAAAAGVSKGALFHHYAGKQALGYALLDDVITPLLRARWLAPLAATDDPLTVLTQLFQRHIGEDIAAGNCRYGCPLNNLAQEMSPVDEGFRVRIDALYAAWRETITAALRRGQRAGTVRRDADAKGAAMLTIFSQMGIWGAGKVSQDEKLMRRAGRAFCAYLDTLRP